ncbi:MAG: sensor histidine kinase [Chitinophagaceae bacterium]|nr:sensor histidine kinase [Chitinophagaceae bacterium]
MPQNPRLSLYWKCQLIGWGVASLYWAYVGFTGTRFSYILAIIHLVGDMVMYIGLTHLFRTISKHYGWQHLAPGPLLIRIIPATLLLGLGFLFLTAGKTYLVRWIFESDFEGNWSAYFNSQWQALLVTGIRLMAIWVLAYYLYQYAQREIRATRESARLALIAKDAQLDNLRAQLNPHFFFNSLNNIKALVLVDPQAARRAIDLLSDLLRTSLYRRDGVQIPLRDELTLINDYLELERMRFEERLQVEIHVEELLLPVPILPLSIQILVENAIKHGIAQRREGGVIRISIVKEDTDLLISVSNPGHLFGGPANGLGLKNLRERLQLQYNGTAGFWLKEMPEGLVCAQIKLPLHASISNPDH